MKKTQKILWMMLAGGLCFSLTMGHLQAQGPSLVTYEKEVDVLDKSVKTTSKKDETVSVKADATGKVTKKTVSVTLKNPGKSDLIEDRTNLTNIKNTEGDEEFTLQDDGTLYFENHNEDINYEGISDEDLPVDVKITYKLDGKTISPKNLAGKSGKVTIRFDYKNHEKRNGVVVPFLAVSTVVLPDDTFKNVKIKNGKLTSIGGQNLAVGMAFPGLEDVLHLSSYDQLKDLKPADYVEIKADVTDFSLDFTATVITPGLFKDVDLDSLNDIDDLTKGLSKLSEASSKLVKGSTQLLKGANAYTKGLRTYTKGVKQINKGVKSLSGYLKQMRQGTKAFSSNLNTINKSVQTLNKLVQDEDLATLLNISEEEAEALKDNIKQMVEDEKTIHSSLQSIKEDLDSYKDYVDIVNNQIKVLEGIDWESIKNDMIANVQTKVSENLELPDTLTDEEKEKIKEAINQAVSESVDLTAVKEKVDGVITTLKNAADKVKDIKTDDLNKAISDLLGRVQAMDKILDKYKESVKNIKGLEDIVKLLKKASKEAAGTSKTMANSASNLDTGMKTLINKGVDPLSKGTQKLSESSSQLISYYGKIVKGIQALSNGMSMFDKEGISKLNKLPTRDISKLSNKLRDLQDADEDYDQFSGRCEDEEISTKFIIETESIKED